MTFDPKSDTIKVDTFKGLMPVKSFVLAKDENCVMMKDLDGNVISKASKDVTGGVSLFDSKGKLAKHFTPEAVQIARERKLGAVLAQK
jgi:hypothetical protein